MIRVHIRWMIRRDHEAVLGIERVAFKCPWDQDSLLNCLRQRNCIGMVAEHAEKVVGFMVYELHKAKLHLINFAVHPDYRRATVGRQMVDKLRSKLASHRRTRLTLVVSDGNLDAQLFWRAMGFRAFKVLRDYFTNGNGRDDGYAMRYMLKEVAGVK